MASQRQRRRKAARTRHHNQAARQARKAANRAARNTINGVPLPPLRNRNAQQVAENLARNARGRANLPKLGIEAKKQSRRMVAGSTLASMRRHGGKVGLAVGALYASGAVIRSTGRPVDKVVGRPTGMYGF